LGLSLKSFPPCNVNILYGNLKSKKSQTSTKLYVHEFGFRLKCCVIGGAENLEIGRKKKARDEAGKMRRKRFQKGAVSEKPY
jgi:hypothetical protein